MASFLSLTAMVREQCLNNNGFENIFVIEKYVHGLKMLGSGRVALWASSDFEASTVAEKAGINPDLSPTKTSGSQ